MVAYILTDALLILPAGRLADRLGHRRTFAAGLATTAVALGGCGLAPDLGALTAARVLQGAGAALVFGSAPALVTLAAPDPVRQKALGWFSLAFGAGMVLGPLAGGVLVAGSGWRAVFLTRVPLALAALLLAWRGCAAGAAARPGPGPAAGRASIADRRTFVLANAANLLGNAALFFVWLLVPYYLVDRRGLGAGTGGLLFAAGALATAVGAPLGGWCAERVGARWLPASALAVEALGLVLVSRLDATSPPGTIALALALAGGGMGLFTVPNMHYVMGALPRARQGWAGGIVVMMRMGGILLGARGAALAAETLGFGHAFLVAAGVAGTAAALSLGSPRHGGAR